MDNPNRFRFSNHEFYLKSSDEMYQLMAGRFGEDMLQRTVEIAERCSAEVGLGAMHLPRFEVPEGTNAVSYLRDLAEQGLRERYGSETPELRHRLEFELKTIEEMGFPDYFLIVWDFIRFARENGISVGPGRGSAAGSLVAYCLRITDLDPMRYTLLFERFLNPGRKSMPDIDVDFAVAGRERVINYVAEKYGRRNVAQIITFGKMQPKAAIKDAGRVMGIPYGVVDRIAKMVPEGPKVSFDECMKPGAELRKTYDVDETAKSIVDMARPLEGVVRNDSIHAAAVVIGDRPLTEYLPLQQKGAGGRGRHAVPDERRRGAGPAEDGLPGPAQPRRDRPRARPDRVELRPAAGHGRRAAGRRPDLRDAGPRRRHRRVPVRVVGDARGAARGQADALRGPDRAGRPVPAWADAEHPAVRRAQERARGGDVRRSAAGGRAGRDLRHHRVPGAGDADQPRDRRLLARRSGRPAQGDRQEDRRADGDAQGQVHRRLHRETA